MMFHVGTYVPTRSRSVFYIFAVYPPWLPTGVQDVDGTREEAEGLVNKCLLQEVDGGDQYRVHDLLVEFLRFKIRQDAGMVKLATVRQAQYLARLDFIRSCLVKLGTCTHCPSVSASWRILEWLSGDNELEAVSYRASLSELDSSEPTADMAKTYANVANLFEFQVGSRWPVCSYHHNAYRCECASPVRFFFPSHLLSSHHSRPTSQ